MMDPFLDGRGRGYLEGGVYFRVGIRLSKASIAFVSASLLKPPVTREQKSARTENSSHIYESSRINANSVKMNNFGNS